MMQAESKERDRRAAAQAQLDVETQRAVAAKEALRAAREQHKDALESQEAAGRTAQEHAEELVQQAQVMLSSFTFVLDEVSLTMWPVAFAMSCASPHVTYFISICPRQMRRHLRRHVQGKQRQRQQLPACCASATPLQISWERSWTTTGRGRQRAWRSWNGAYKRRANA